LLSSHEKSRLHFLQIYSQGPGDSADPVWSAISGTLDELQVSPFS
jgi:hypothetical protein